MNGGDPSVLLELDVCRMTGAHGVRDRLQSVGQHVATGQHGEHARRAHRRGNVDRPDQRMRVRRADHHRIGLAGHIDVVAVAAASGQQAQIFPAPHRLSDPGAGGTE